jgi:hypothetical protein
MEKSKKLKKAKPSWDDLITDIALYDFTTPKNEKELANNEGE